MSRDEHYSPFAPAPGPRIPTHGELLYEFVATLAMGPTRVRCELVDHGPNGFEARICYDDQHHMSHVFAPWHCIPFVTPRAGLSRPLLKFSGGSGGLD